MPPIRLDSDNLELEVDGAVVPITPSMVRLLEPLLQRPGRSMPCVRLEELVYGVINLDAPGQGVWDTRGRLARRLRGAGIAPERVVQLRRGRISVSPD